ncbi:MAG: hypothetical protein ACJ74T_13065 [Pyrinomonadaceae bacterium]
MRVHAAEPALMRQPEGGPGEGGGPEPKPVGPFLLPEVTVTAKKSAATGPPFAPDDKMARFSVRDVTFVKVPTWEEVKRRAKILNKLAEDEAAQQRRKLEKPKVTVGPGADEVQQQQDEAAQNVLKGWFGDYWGIAWYLRGGGQKGLGQYNEDGEVWGVLRAVNTLNRGVRSPLPAYQGAKQILPPAKLPYTPNTEIKK